MEKEQNVQPLISVIMPAHNAEKYITVAMESVFRQKGDFAIELYVVNDASTDNTERVVEDWLAAYKNRKEISKDCCNCELIYLKNEHNIGVAETRNRAIRLARGEYIAFLDADDWWQEDKLSRQMALIRERNAILCATGRELMRADGESLGRVIGIPQEITYEMLLRTNCIPCSAAVIRTEVAREFYMQHAELHEDYILWLRVLKKYGRAYGLDEPMLKSRMSEAGKSRNKLKSARMQFGVYRYLGFGIFKSLFYFVQYAVNGVKKYSK